MKRDYGTQGAGFTQHLCIGAGFTLIELMIVVVIIGILAVVAIPRFMNQQRKAKESAAWADLSSISKALDNYLLDCDNYPLGTAGTQSTSSGLQHLITNADSEVNWVGPYMRYKHETSDWPYDPWGNAYEYEGSTNGRDYTIWCKGGGYASDYSAVHINPGAFRMP